MIRRGFTLVELLIAMGIIALLMTLLLPAINRARKAAVRTTLLADMQTIATGLDAYRNDFGDYPRPDKFVPAPFQGSEIIAWALVSPGPASFDGADGYGFRKRGIAGPVYGPYVTPGNFRFGVATTSPSLQPSGIIDSHICLGDRAGNAILYFPSKLTATSIAAVNNYLGPPGKATRYASKDNDPQVATGTESGPNPDAAGALRMMQSLLPGVGADGVTLDQSQLLTLPYLLWDAGPDGRFGTPDDVTNFRP